MTIEGGGDGPGGQHWANLSVRASGEVAMDDRRALETGLERAFGDRAPALAIR